MRYGDEHMVPSVPAHIVGAARLEDNLHDLKIGATEAIHWPKPSAQGLSAPATPRQSNATVSPTPLTSSVGYASTPTDPTGHQVEAARQAARAQHSKTDEARFDAMQELVAEHMMDTQRQLAYMREEMEGYAQGKIGSNGS